MNTALQHEWNVTTMEYLKCGKPEVKRAEDDSKVRVRRYGGKNVPYGKAAE